MKALVHAEVLKLRSTRTSALLLLATLGLEVMTVVVTVPAVGAASPPVALDDPGLLTAVVANSFGAPQVLVVLFGAMMFTQEYRYGTAAATYLVEPRRARVLVAKWLSSALASVVVSVVTLAVALAIGVPLITSRHGDLTVATPFWQVLVMSFVVMAAYAVIGVALGALLRNQVVAVVAVLVWMLAVEHFVVLAYPDVGRWTPGAATWSLTQLGPSIDMDGELLPIGVAGVVLLGYCVVAVALALHVTPRKDVL